MSAVPGLSTMNSCFLVGHIEYLVYIWNRFILCLQRLNF